ncbi:trypsin-like peptidase domain-containing protein [Actinoplanes regularis]|uniref:Trypsin-like peptidase domain-containing protein n=1 Tax=Actinoplanes regularis TaxID=52697 RepID=A0A239C4T7_9ACTN|nr:trypsin-like peptidase domain-containing protein [Actinoplanes regularis]GIE88121.1 hypothetical protein Are01nite_46010 [Actinoplanes regularis]SNS14939.1 Trypsin-like peptidase domain-containing protein [Actinoplanes regularis]
MDDLIVDLADGSTRLTPGRTWYLVARPRRLEITVNPTAPERIAFLARMISGWYLRIENPAAAGISLDGQPVRDRSTLITGRSAVLSRTISDAMPAAAHRSGWDQGAVTRALRSACPTYADLELLLARDLYVELYAIVPPGDMRVVSDRVIRAARENFWLGELLAAIRFAAPEDPVLDQVVPRFDQESIVDRAKGIFDLPTFLAGVTRISARVCRIQVADRAAQVFGTGFLIGPDLMMTCRHVLERLFTGVARPDQVIVTFDFHSQADLTARLQSSLGLAPDWRVADAAGELDFALVRLNGTPGTDEVESGERRSWFYLLDEKDPEPGAHLFIPQHPRGAPLKAAIGEVLDNGSGHGLFTHRANTRPGSSGSPCFTFDLDLVAMHRAGWKDDPADGNAAVPISAVLRHLRAGGFDMNLLGES